jgi:hypothetical protein
VDLVVTAEQTISIRALVDTGAPGCIFGAAVADAVGIDMKPGQGSDRQIHILGREHSARMGHATLELPPFDGLTWDVECAFLHGDLDLSFAGVLGQEGFLDRWVASFNYYDGYFIIEERDGFVERLGTDPADVVDSAFYDSEWQRPTIN